MRLSRSRAEGPAAEYQDGVIAVDGKALRRSSADASERQPPHPACAFAAGTRPAPAQTAADGKPDEITAIPALKGNQGKLHGNVKRYMENPGSIENIQFSETHKEKGHDRIETRLAAVCHDVGWLEKTAGSLVSPLSDPSRRSGKSGESAVLSPGISP